MSLYSVNCMFEKNLEAARLELKVFSQGVGEEARHLIGKGLRLITRNVMRGVWHRE